MAERINNNKGFLVIKINNEEGIKCKFGITDENGNNHYVCDNCNEYLNEKDKYYIPVINRLLCEKCYNDFIKRSKHYKEDSRYEVYYYNAYAKILGLPLVKIHDLKFDDVGKDGIDDE